MLMTSRLSLSRIVLLISLSIVVMLSLLGVWQVQRFRQQVRTANARVPSYLQSADVLEMFGRANRQRVAENLIFYLPTNFELSHLMKQPNASHEVALEMQRSLHTSLDAWLTPDYTLLDSLLHAHLLREGLPLSYELQRVDFSNNRETFRVVHTQRWMPWKSQDFRPTADALADTLFVSDDYTQAYVLRYESAWKVVLRNEAPSLILLVLFLVASILVLALLRWRQQQASATTQFVHNLSHELKTPLAVAQAAHEALLDFKADEDATRRQELLRTSQRQLGRLQHLVTSLLDALRPQPKGRAPQWTMTTLLPLLQQLQDDHELRHDKSVSIFLEVTPEDLEFSTDALMLCDVLNNLIDNAIKYTLGDAVVDVSAWADCDNQHVVIEVTDQGVGIPKREQRKIFHRFYRVGQGDVQQARGYGLGLYHVKTLVRQLDGHITVKSEMGKGSTFRVTLPMQAAAATEH